MVDMRVADVSSWTVVATGLIALGLLRILRATVVIVNAGGNVPHASPTHDRP